MNSLYSTLVSHPERITARALFDVYCVNNQLTDDWRMVHDNTFSILHIDFTDMIDIIVASSKDNE